MARGGAAKKRPHLIKGGAEGDAMPARKPVNPSLTAIVGKCEGATGLLLQRSDYVSEAGS